MKKIFTLIASAFIALSAFAQTTLIDYPASEAGIAIEGTTAKGTVKIHTNKDAVDCLQLKNGYSADGAYNGNSIKLTTAGGFKKGDVVTLTGYINNADETKRATAVLFTIDGTATTKVHQFNDLLNGRIADGDATPESYTLEADATDLYLGRDGGTTANITAIKVVRTGGGNDPTPGGDAEKYIVCEGDVNGDGTITIDDFKPEWKNAQENATDADGMKVEIEPTANVKLTYMSGPIANYTDGKELPLQVSIDNTWQIRQWNIDDAKTKMLYYLEGKGNPFANKDGIKFILKSEEKPDEGYKADWTDSYYLPDGSRGLPQNGAYMTFQTKVDGKLSINCRINKGSRKVYVVDADSKKALDPATNLKYSGYINGYNKVDGECTYTEFEITTDDNGNQYIPQTGYRGDVFMGNITFNTTANKTYYIFNENTQIGFGGYEFTTGTTGISDIVVEKAQNDAIYNIAGQRVFGSAKGLVIKNGKKYFVK